MKLARGAQSNEGGVAPSASLRALPWQGTNEQLLVLVRSGAPSAASLIYDRFEKTVHGLVWKLLGGDPEHDDVVQEAFIQILRGAARVREAEKLKAWVSSVTVNVVRRELRRRTLRRTLFLSGGDGQDAVAETSDNPEALILTRKVYSVLSRMPTDQRLCFTLRHLEGHTVLEVADLCDCSKSSVERRLRRAETFFKSAAARDPALAQRMTEGRDVR